MYRNFKNLLAIVVMTFGFSIAASAANPPNFVEVTPQGVVSMNGDEIALDLDHNGVVDGVGVSPSSLGPVPAFFLPGRVSNYTLQPGTAGAVFPTGGTAGRWIGSRFKITFPNNPELCALGQVPPDLYSVLTAPGSPACWANYLPAGLTGVYLWESLPGGGCRETGVLIGATTFARIQSVPSLAGTPGCTFQNSLGQDLSWTSLALNLQTRKFCPNATNVTPNCADGGDIWEWTPGNGGNSPGTVVNTDVIFKDGLEQPI